MQALILINYKTANHDGKIPSLKHQIDKDSLSWPSMDSLTHSQAPARKRNRKGSWGGLKKRILAIVVPAANEFVLPVKWFSAEFQVSFQS